MLNFTCQSEGKSGSAEEQPGKAKVGKVVRGLKPYSALSLLYKNCYLVSMERIIINSLIIVLFDTTFAKDGSTQLNFMYQHSP